MTMLLGSKCLPFPRGYTAADGVVTPDDSWKSELEGQVFWTEDTEHGTGYLIGLMVVKNDTGAAITIARRFCEFSITDSLDFRRRIGTFPANTEGAVAVPLDDAYTVGNTIADDDLFYVLVSGPCSVETGGVGNFVAGMSVMTSALGKIRDLAAVPAGDFVIGTLDTAASYTANSTAIVLVDAFPLKMPPAAG